jgi:uncharacterized membrane protein
MEELASVYRIIDAMEDLYIALGVMSLGFFTISLVGFISILRERRQ